MNDNNRRYFSPEQRVAILREHLIEAKAVSDLCDKHDTHPTVFYEWQRQFFENGTAAFEVTTRKCANCPVRETPTTFRGSAIRVRSDASRRALRLFELPIGVGALSLITLQLEIRGWERFQNRRQIASYTRLRPGIHNSNGRGREGSINRCGNSVVVRFLTS